jgi:hypothetical protein
LSRYFTGASGAAAETNPISDQNDADDLIEGKPGEDTRIVFVEAEEVDDEAANAIQHQQRSPKVAPRLVSWAARA